MKKWLKFINLKIIKIIAVICQSLILLLKLLILLLIAIIKKTLLLLLALKMLIRKKLMIILFNSLMFLIIILRSPQVLLIKNKQGSLELILLKITKMYSKLKYFTQVKGKAKNKMKKIKILEMVQKIIKLIINLYYFPLKKT
jgi:hypothetical protein